MEWNERIKELVAVGASITANCQPCLQYHADKARKEGATPQEIEAAIGVGKQVRKGASAKMDEFSTGLKETICAPAGEKKSACCA